MKAKSKLLALFGLVGLGIAGNASATPAYAVPCSGCDSTQMLAAANANIIHGTYDATAWSAGYVGVLYVFDPAVGKLYQYGLKQNPSTGRDSAVYIGAAPSGIQTAYNNVQAAVAQNGGNFVFTINEDTKDTMFPERDRALNAYDIAQTTQAQNDIIDWINNKYNGSANSGIIGYLFQITIGSSPLVVKIVIHMNDYSKVTFQFANGEITFVSAVDANNNNIPLKLDQTPGKYNFGSGGSAGNFLDYMHQQFGYTHPTVPTCVNYTIACTFAASERYCQILPCN